MSSLTSTLQSPKFQRRFFWVALLVLIAGIAFGAAQLLIGSGTSTQTPVGTAPAKDVSKVPKTVKLDPGAKKVAQQFILTAVARKNLKQAYALAGPAIRQGQTLKQWMTGDIAVVPYPVGQLDIAPMKIDYSYKNEAGIEVALLPKKGSKVKGQLFAMQLVKQHGKWYVNAWVPNSKPPIPCGGENC
jgi:hypothetical protein